MHEVTKSIYRDSVVQPTSRPIVAAPQKEDSGPRVRTALRNAALMVLLGGMIMAYSQRAEAGNGPGQGGTESYPLSSGIYNGDPAMHYPTLAYKTKVQIAGADWIRLYFENASLGSSSYLVITSLKDGDQQGLNSSGLAQWHNSSAYFNGDAVEIELFVAPNDSHIFFNLENVSVGTPFSAADRVMSLCGTDERQPSSNPAVGRIWDTTSTNNFATAWISATGHLVTAGHVAANWDPPDIPYVVEFDVPPSLPDGSAQHPPASDQYNIFGVINNEIQSTGTTGQDWAVFDVYSNSETGLKPIQAQHAFFNVEQNDNAQRLTIIGYGEGTGVGDNAQQSETGPNDESTGEVLMYQVDTEPGSSGSPVIDSVTGNVVGIHTNDGCTSGGGANAGTSMYNTGLWNALQPVTYKVMVSQVNSNNQQVGTVGQWNGSSFTGVALGDSISFTTGQPQVLMADHGIYTGQKYNTWSNSNVNDPDVTNPHMFYIMGGSAVSHFQRTVNASIQSHLLETNSVGFPVDFADPWLIDYNDPTYKVTRNEGMSAPFKSVAYNSQPPYNLGSSPYNGVFPNQFPEPANPLAAYYTAAAPLTQAYDGHTWAFTGWSATGAAISDGGPIANGFDSAAVVFDSNDAVVTANYKGFQLSNDPSAFSNNSQRKLIRTPNGPNGGTLHEVYTSAGHVWYEYSTDNGTTWHLGKNWLATGPYGPLDGTAGGKDPSIDYDPQTNNVVIVWQQKSSNGYYTIQYMTFWPDDYVQNTYSINSYGTLYTDGSDAYSSVNANPNIAVNATASGGTEFWVLSLEKYHWYITAGDTVFGGIDVLWGTFSGGNTLDISQDNYGGDLPTHIAGTNYASVNATIYGNKTSAGGYNGSNSGWTFPLAWQQNPGINGTQIKYTQLTLYYDGNGVLALHQDPVTQLSQSNTPDNHNPSIIAIPGSNGPTYAICWLLDFTGEGLSTTTRVCYTSGNNTSLNYVGSLPQSCSLNVSDDNSVSYFVWSQGSAPWSDYVVSTSNLGSAIALNSTGDGMQLANGSGKSNMYEISYLSSGSAPYAISPAIGLGSVGSLQSTAPDHLSDSSRTVAGAPVQAFDSRGVVIGNDSASLQYLFGDITVDGKSVPFVTIPDTFKSRFLER